jgi:hypothetical protein
MVILVARTSVRGTVALEVTSNSSRAVSSLAYYSSNWRFLVCQDHDQAFHISDSRYDRAWLGYANDWAGRNIFLHRWYHPMTYTIEFSYPVNSYSFPEYAWGNSSCVYKRIDLRDWGLSREGVSRSTKTIPYIAQMISWRTSPDFMIVGLGSQSLERCPHTASEWVLIWTG